MSDPTIAAQIDVLAGTNSGTRERTHKIEGLMRSVVDLGICRDRPIFDPEHFDKEYSRFEEAYYDRDIVYEVIAPLPTVEIARSVTLSDDLEITNLSLEPLNPNSRGKTTETRSRPFGDKVCVVRSECRLPKVVGDDKEHDLQGRKKDEDREIAVHKRIEQVINALRLCEIENAYPSVIIHRTSQWAFDQDRFFPGKPPPEISYTSNLENQWLDGFEQFWKNLESDGVRKRPFLNIAIRRFGVSHDRRDIVDRVIDLMIAAEAFFLSDKDATNEIRYRLSLRAAFFLVSSSQAQKTVFEWMKKAYDLRSAVAHGRDAKSVKLPKLPDGSHVSLDQFVATFQAYIRGAILKGIDIAQQPNARKHLIEWDDLPFAH